MKGFSDKSYFHLTSTERLRPNLFEEPNRNRLIWHFIITPWRYGDMAMGSSRESIIVSHLFVPWLIHNCWLLQQLLCILHSYQLSTSDGKDVNVSAHKCTFQLGTGNPSLLDGNGNCYSTTRFFTILPPTRYHPPNWSKSFKMMAFHARALFNGAFAFDWIEDW